MNNEVMSIEPAYRRTLEILLKQGYEINQIVPINRSRYILVTGKLHEKEYNIMIIYKREHFLKFGEIFASEGEKGIGETLNTEHLEIAQQHGVKTIFAVFPNGVVYSCSLSDFIMNGHSRINKEGIETMSVSIHLFKREFEL